MTNPIYARPVERPAVAFEARAQAEVVVGGSLSPAGPPRAPRLVDRQHR
jgi:hypothetical protein